MKMNKSTSFEDAARVWLSIKRLEVKGNTYAESYDRTINKILLPRMQGCKLGDIDRLYVADLMNELADIYSDSTLNKCQLVLKGIMKEATYAGAQLVPLPRIKVRSKIGLQQKRTYSETEATQLRQYCHTHPWGLSVQLMLDLGLRCSEMLALRWEDLDLKAGTVKINRGCVDINGKPVVDVPKSKSSIRELPIPADLTTQLRHLERGSIHSGYVINTGEKLMTPANYTKRYNRLFADLEIETALRRLSPHELRHTCGTLLYQRTGDLYAVSKFLGHSSVAITAKYYVHSDVEKLRERLGI